MIQQLKQIPFWIWVILPIFILGFITYLVSKNRKTTTQVTLGAFFLAWGTAGFHFWETYLYNHFIGGFNEFGLPDNYSDTGWGLMIDAWPLWLIPTILAVVLSLIISYFYREYRSSSTPIDEDEETDQQPVMTGISSSGLAHQLEIQKLKQQVEIAKEKYQELKHQSGTDVAKKEMKAITNKLNESMMKNKVLQKQVQQLTGDMTRSKKVIEKLLDERIKMKQQLQSQGGAEE